MKKVIVFLFALGLSATAIAYEQIEDQRRVDTFSTAGNSFAQPDAPFEDFQTVGQSSSFDSDGFGGSLRGYGESDFDFFVQLSYFDITFEFLQRQSFEIIGTSFGNGGNFGTATGRVRLYAGDQADAQNVLFDWSLDADTFDEYFDTIEYSETLPAGVYRLVIDTDLTPGGFETYMDIDFDVLLPGPLDSDGDSIPNDLDNCITVANDSQLDADDDGYGNACDADFNNDCEINVVDLGLLRAAFFSADSLTDLNGDGVVNVVDLGILRAMFFALPGPSGLTQACSPGQ